MKTKKVIIRSLLAALALAVVVCGASAFYTVEENEYACVVRFSKIISTTDTAGLHMKMPFIDSTKIFPKAIMLYDIPPSEVLTSDKQNMTVDSYVLWRISDPLLFYQSLGSTTVAEQRLDAITYNALKTVMGTLSQKDIINEEPPSERNDIYAGISSNVSNLAKNYGIDIVDVKIKRLDLPEANEQAVYQRMISERKQMAEKYTADGEYEASIIRNNVDKQVNIIVSNARAKAAELQAQGEAEYMKMLANAYNTQDKQEFYAFTQALDALLASLDGNEKTIILSRDSELARLLISPN
ncbi:MAG: protease modulator HflC [Oscillospiraceae bacterium]|nr:protease modulator HflC [Oscillospiraceae bacterium]